ncbi:hypothetical protein [Spirochaeta africana]|uniref:Uncharacterized protein n=1 Tax=Spirochaeta africana (strain ATCC 700263 / DSM 8902 / Z-7692) TaxID=889378 RepID=H9UHQ1_SPIAZ|nr:hypothetical protein [Spirochaeta africana]AFG37044.1 hypothetical protein Spiaf_0955 [Spirochaeta africana DSM 8902]
MGAMQSRVHYYHWRMQLHSPDFLDDWVEEYLDAVQLEHLPDGTTCITCALPDIAAVYGRILQIRDSGIAVLSLHVDRINREKEIDHA